MTHLIWFGNAALALVVILSIAAPVFFAARAGQVKNSNRLSADFFELANKLVDDDDTPELVVSYLESMAGLINDRDFSRRILGHALTGKLRDISNAPSAGASELLSVIRGMRQDLKGMVARASVSCMLSVTYKSAVFGVFVRRIMFYAMERDQEQAEIVAISGLTG